MFLLLMRAHRGRGMEALGVFVAGQLSLVMSIGDRICVNVCFVLA